MKKIMLSALFLAFGTTALFAQTDSKINNETVIVIQEDKTPIKLEELPDSVKTTLAGEDYRGWLPVEAFVITPEEGVKHYEIVLKNSEGEKKVVKLDENGKAILDLKSIEEEN